METKKSVKKNNPETKRQKEIRKWTMRFIDRYREALEALAKNKIICGQR